jgi:NAD(P)-dependent dehydrogenase (short-subunit alcohol dehydrogenase family)
MMTLATVLVTGSSSGLGRNTAETLARRGYTVFASMRASSGKNAGVASELRALARDEALDLHVLDLDVTDDESVQSAVATIIERTGRIDVVVNNAGFGFSGISEAMLIEQVHHQFDVNLYGVLRVNQAVLPHMRRQRSGLLVYVASTASQIVVPMLGMYSATKAALAAMARGIAYEVQSLGIDTTIIQAGGFATEFGANVMKAANDEVWSEYGEMGQFATAFTDGMDVALEPGVASDPQLFADLVADLIAAPRGARPLYVPIGMGSEPFDLINQAIDGVERQSLRMFGLDQFVRNTPAYLPATMADELEEEWLARAA